MRTICSVFLLISISTIVQPVQSTAVMEKIEEVEHVRGEISKIITNGDKNKLFTSILNKESFGTTGLISWLFNLIKQLIELIKKPLERLSTLFSKLAGLFSKLQVLMDDIILLVDWIVRKAIIAVIISIMIMIIDFIKFIIKFIEEMNPDTDSEVAIWNHTIQL
jgi:hypothetical protein